MTRDLSADPAWQEKDLGLPLPDSPHACSVCLPTWDSVVGYEEGRKKIMKRLRVGYPRFFKHPTVERLFDNAKNEVAGENEEVVVLPTRSSVQRAHRWVERRAQTAVRTTSFNGLQALIVPAKAKADADAYWRFSGEVVSSRQAQDFLDGKPREGSKSHLIVRKLRETQIIKIRWSAAARLRISSMESRVRARSRTSSSGNYERHKLSRFLLATDSCLRLGKHSTGRCRRMLDASELRASNSLHLETRNRSPICKRGPKRLA